MKYASLRQGLVGAWCPSLGPTGNTLLDRSGYGNHGTLTNMDAGTDWVGSRYGWALDFDNVNDQVAINSSLPNFDPANRIISFFVRFHAVNANSYIVGNESNLASGNGLGIYLRSTGAMRCYNYNANFALDTNFIFTQNTWTHYAMSFDGTTTRAYINGLLDNSRTGDSGIASTTNYLIGKWQQGDLFLNGQLDDLRFYSRVLTAQEIALLASEPGIGLKPEPTSVFFGAQLFNAAWAKNSNQLITAGVI